MKIVLIYPLWSNTYGEIQCFAKKAGKWPPLNLAFLAAISEKLGYTVKIIDAEAENLTNPEVVKKVVAFQPDIIGFTATTPFYHIVADLAKCLKERLPDVPITLGGAHVTVLKEQVFKDCFDVAFIGEAEDSWCDYLEKNKKGQCLADIDGIIYRDGEKVVSTPLIPKSHDMTKLPVPARHLLDNNNYILGTMHGDKKFTSIMTTRGCPFNCIFCSTDVFGKNIRLRDPAFVIKEMKACIKNFGIEHFSFLDETMTLNKAHITRICELIIQEKLNITFEGSTRANLVDEELIALMARAGLIRLSFGLESVDETIRKNMKKQVPLESYRVANKLTNKYGIETLNSCMIGLPGETRESIRKTLAFLRESKEIKQANISIAVPYPGTELYEMAVNEQMGLKLIVDDFSQFRRYNTAVMQVGEFSPEDLKKIQNEAFASIYLAPWRWEPMLKKSGLDGAILTIKRLMTAIDGGETSWITDKQLGVDMAGDSHNSPD